ncbi:GNAT family N-acetyltransferase [Nocardioides euryhalodurans]|uniref:GNAT family N-acetyltransferase n=1 Tax=Nocardioides euryhalodurans TaxID=2518370 RepID=A0A4P7GQD9_9ACTN|nr:GNAT family N-acetyltransferase [Nocardioides euryhalodurans]
MRPATGSDAGAIAGVHRLSRASYYGTVPNPDDGREAFWARFLCESERSTYVAESADGVVGFVTTTRVSDPVPTLELTSLYVHPDRVGRGIGSRLYDAFADDRRPGERGVLEVWAGNPRAIAFYERRGWTATTRTRPGPEQLHYVTHELRP